MSIKLSGKNLPIGQEKEFQKEERTRILFSDEKVVDLDGTYNSENDRIWADNREEANRRREKEHQRQSPEK